MFMMEITKSEIYYVTWDKSFPWTEWQTNREGTYWLNLMGLSWEEMEPPEELLKEFLNNRDR